MYLGQFYKCLMINHIMLKQIYQVEQGGDIKC